MELLHAGRVGRPHGLDGSFHVTRPRAVLLAVGGAVHLGATVRTIVRCAGTADRPILRLEGVDDRAGAEALRGEDLLVARADAPPLPDGEFWAEDLEGCLVVTPGGAELGHVEHLRALPSCEALEVGELLVPMVADAVLEVRLDRRLIVVDPEFLGVGEGERGAFAKGGDARRKTGPRSHGGGAGAEPGPASDGGEAGAERGPRSS